MSFDLIARNLLNQPKVDDNDNLTRASALSELAREGFSPQDIFRKMSEIYDTTEDDTLRKQILDMATKVHGLYKDDDNKKETPKVMINIKGDNDKIYQMLCPPVQPENAEAA